METLQLLPVCFLLLSTSFADVQEKFAEIKCNESIRAEIGDDVNITCTNNEKITNSTVTFCTNCALCPNSSDINTFENNFTADNGRITLKIYAHSVILHINRVQVSDQRTYHFFLMSNNGFRNICVPLGVVSPGQAELSAQRRFLATGPVPSESEKGTAEADKEAISKEAKYSIIALTLIVVLAFSVALYWRKKKGGINLPWRTPPYHQPRFPEVFPD
ncbi:uncharacterized protein LOC129326925 [Eublepharis macularius]|uniref:Uncharacterized protein LOC129326925 n=1 Tax=Eublepharis macularius TaxID=481883 RepID=A0AA97J486_EUBMA|nr:uncharacterized protein LOC129326925 [Eublepharis macularius]